MIIESVGIDEIIRGKELRTTFVYLPIHLSGLVV